MAYSMQYDPTEEIVRKLLGATCKFNPTRDMWSFCAPR